MKTRSMVQAFGDNPIIKEGDASRVGSSYYSNEANIADARSEILDSFSGFPADINQSQWADDLKGLACKEGYAVKIFSEKNFGGDVLFEKTGPFLIYDNTLLDFRGGALRNQAPNLDLYLEGFGITASRVFGMSLHLLLPYDKPTSIKITRA